MLLNIKKHYDKMKKVKFRNWKATEEPEFSPPYGTKAPQKAEKKEREIETSIGSLLFQPADLC